MLEKFIVFASFLVGNVPASPLRELSMLGPTCKVIPLASTHTDTPCSVLLDDVLAAVDSHVARHIFSALLLLASR